ncbi:Fur family transcriptional regulator [Timonella senegalensis]|uniref:Fur family transcriptional regulator n=1 Tax=Timonella senegalensis TaxID=1465825 RepID=UPI0028A986D5|nr:Fur family transcriptional regulator [Timonella senegalensis]
MNATTPHDALRSRNLRVTAIRLAILEVLGEHRHVGADQVLSLVRTKLGTASVQAVYDALHALAAAALINEIEPAGHPARYELRVGDNHHHLICRTCGRIEDVDCAIGASPCLTPSSTHGFVIDQAEVTYWGTCAACAGTQPQSS